MSLHTWNLIFQLMYWTRFIWLELLVRYFWEYCATTQANICIGIILKRQPKCSSNKKPFNSSEVLILFQTNVLLVYRQQKRLRGFQDFIVMAATPQYTKTLPHTCTDTFVPTTSCSQLFCKWYSKCDPWTLFLNVIKLHSLACAVRGLLS